jgi:hypothetical protein
MKPQAKDTLEKAASVAIGVISQAAEEAVKVLSHATAEQVVVASTKTADDHDLIIEIKTIQEMMLGELKEIKTGTADQISNHQTRITALETSKTRQNTTMGIGIALLTLLVGLLVYHIIGLKP